MEHALLMAMRQAVEARLGRSAVVVVVDGHPRMDVSLLLPDLHTEVQALADNKVGLRPRRPRVKRRGKGLQSPVDNEREERERLKQLQKTLHAGKKTPYNRRIGKR